MAKAPKVKSPEAVGFKEIFGSTALSTNNGIAAVFMSAMFMTFMTDYAGLGKMGATLATVLLLAARIIDAVDDPIQGFIMDSGKIGKHGKYKPFFLISIIMTTIGVIALYALPNGITSKAVVVSIWVIFFYLAYDIGASFYNQNLLFRTMTNDPGERSKLLIGPRLWVMILGMFGSAMAVKEQHIKRRLAYSTVSNLSYIVFGAALMTPAGLAGGLTHMLFHGVMKITLFSCAGAIMVQTGRSSVQEMRGYAAPEEIELCSVCNENPALPGHDVCAQCLREMQNHEEPHEEADEAHETIDAENLSGVESVAEMDEIIPDMDESMNNPEFWEMTHTLSLESVREDEEKEQDEADAEEDEDR